MRATVILNRRSSRAERHLHEIPGLLHDRGIDVERLIVVAGEGDLRKTLKRVVRRRPKILIVGGGDGSIATAVDVLAHTRTVLGVLPLGTGNSFALTLGIPEDLHAALGVVAARRVERVDLGIANGRHFANFATIGLSAEIAAATPHALKPIAGPWAYVLGGIRSFFTHRPYRATIKANGRRVTIGNQQMVVASGRFFGRTPVLPDATITNGRLALFTTSGTSYLDVVRTYVAFGLGLQTHLPDAFAISARKIRVRTRPKQPLSLDGDAYGTTPVRFGVARRALRVFVPPDFDDRSK